MQGNRAGVGRRPTTAVIKVDGHPHIKPAVQLAIRFVALTAARGAEVRRATWDESDLDAAVWTVPAEHMKRAREHRVPLSTGARGVLDEARRRSTGKLAFPNPKGAAMRGTMLADNLSAARIGTTAHGFRSSFKDWARNEGVDELLSEFALAHVEGPKTVAAYARDDLLEKRRPVMQAWSDYVTGAPGN